MKGSIHVKLRPLKFAFLINPGDTNALLEAIKTNSLLWGGEIIFATLKPKLSEKEKKMILPLANKARKLRLRGLPCNPIMILTSAELLSDYEPPYVWNEIGGFHQSYYEKYHNNYGRFNLSDITQEMYLGMQPWEEWYDKESAKLYQNGADI
jgi:hypothetical protein